MTDEEKEFEEIEAKAQKAIRFWTREYDGAYPPHFHHPVSDMEKIRLYVDKLLKSSKCQQKKIVKLKEGIKEIRDMISSDIPFDAVRKIVAINKLTKLSIEEKSEEHSDENQTPRKII